jgi:hypothetical protein
MLNLNDDRISNLFVNKYNFKKIMFPSKDNDDFFYQIYLVNNAKIIFSEIGKWFINIYYMNKGNHILSIEAPSIPTYTNTLINVCDTNNINHNIYYKTSLDLANEHVNNYNQSNLPYKIDNIDDFVDWSDNILTKIIN